jgi:protein-S-isoprenylcysteine O-methyltransferase Ste14
MNWTLNPKINKVKFVAAFVLSAIVWGLATAVILTTLRRVSYTNGVAVVIGGILFFVGLCLFTTIIIALSFGIIDLKEKLFVRKNGSNTNN